jgi:hypothetical protein
MARRAIGIATVGLVLAGCVISGGGPEVEYIGVPTQGAPAGGVDACMDALASGTLVDDPRWGIALAQDAGSRLQVVWPAGYVARRTDSVLELVDADGQTVARSGDRVTVAGGMGLGEAWWACGAPELADDAS